MINPEILICAVCGNLFQCDHEMVIISQGMRLKVPHCRKCYFDDGKCPDKHGVQCENCQKIQI